jgi:ureidoacrylate peracid hydrolase
MTFANAGRTLRINVIDPTRTALLAVNFQKRALTAGPGSAARHTIEKTNALAGALRNAGGRVIWLRHTVSLTAPQALPHWLLDAQPGFREHQHSLQTGQPGHALLEQMEVASEDIIHDKYRSSPFLGAGSEFPDILRRLGVRTVIITGSPTNTCCESTARDAAMLDLKVVFVSDATSAETENEHMSALKTLGMYYCDVRSAAEILLLIRSGGGAGM